MSTVILLSGGQDSATAAFWAKRKLPGPHHALTFSYGQRHHEEIQAASFLAALWELPWTLLSVEELFRSLSANALTHDLPITQGEKLPSTFVPGRNLIFLSLAASWGYDKGVSYIVIGASEVDYSGYPDCRAGFLLAAEAALSHALDKKISVVAPFLFRNKAQIWELARRMGILHIIRDKTLTCYEGVKKRHEWGLGCGECPACILRKNGYWEAFRNQDF
ncbi:MAG: 7-cyano-7-deazaguanine synthase QueC [Bacteroidia bacterium]